MKFNTYADPDMAIMNWCSLPWAWPPRSEPPGTSYR